MVADHVNVLPPHSIITGAHQKSIQSSLLKPLIVPNLLRTRIPILHQITYPQTFKNRVLVTRDPTLPECDSFDRSGIVPPRRCTPIPTLDIVGSINEVK